jgi:hypothetical protein
MPSKPQKAKAAQALRTIPKELIDQFVNGPMSAEAVNAASMAFKKALIERALGAELTHHLGYAPGADKPSEANNHRNGATGKTVLTEDGPLRIEVPRDRAGSFEPLLIGLFALGADGPLRIEVPRDRAGSFEPLLIGLFATRTSCHLFQSNQLRMLLAAFGYVLIERLRALALQGTELATAQVDTLRIRLLKLAAVVTRNTRRIRLYLASNWPSAEVFAQAMSALRSP